VKDWIIKSNEWYDDLPENKRFLFFLIVIGGSLLLCQYLLYSKQCIWALPVWVIVFFSWRFGYIILKEREKHKKK